MTMADNLTVAAVMEELTSVAQKQRDPSIPAGTVLAESESRDESGNLLMATREIKQNSMVRNGKVQLPERFAAWDKFGNMSMLPTAQMGRMLAKERADSPGERAFHTHTGGKTRATCGICPPEMQPIDMLCEFCTGVRSQKPTFFSEEQLISHQRVAHTLEYQTKGEALERADRRASIDAQNRLAEAMLEVARTNNQPVAEAKPSKTARE